MIDPFISRNGFISVVFCRIKPDIPVILSVLQRLEIHKLDAVALTHTHYDHALDAPEIVRLTQARLVGNSSSVIIGRSTGLPETQLVGIHPQEKIIIGDLALTFYKNNHLLFPGIIDHFVGARDEIKKDFALPAHALAYRAGEVYSILVEDASCKDASRRLLIIGSTGYIHHGLQGCAADVVCLSFGGLDWKSHTYLTEYFQESILVPGAKRVILTHWDDFTQPLVSEPRISRRITSKIEEIKKLGEKSGVLIEKADLWQTFEI
jgi:L-ascorbate metabolism protein UlaG (beta-lactamase superfamily)